MLTKNDVEILKEIFVTKEEFHREIDKVRSEMKQNTESILFEIRDMVKLMGQYMHRTETLEHQFQAHLADHKSL